MDRKRSVLISLTFLLPELLHFIRLRLCSRIWSKCKEKNETTDERKYPQGSTQTQIQEHEMNASRTTRQKRGKKKVLLLPACAWLHLNHSCEPDSKECWQKISLNTTIIQTNVSNVGARRKSWMIVGRSSSSNLKEKNDFWAPGGNLTRNRQIAVWHSEIVFQRSSLSISKLRHSKHY